MIKNEELGKYNVLIFNLFSSLKIRVTKARSITFPGEVCSLCKCTFDNNSVKVSQWKGR